MALAALSGDEQRIVFSQLCNVLDPRGAVDFSSISHGLRAPTQALLQQLKADHEAAGVLCGKMGMWSCKELRKAKEIELKNTDLSASDLALLGELGAALRVKHLILGERSAAGAGGVQRLVEGLGVGALPAMIFLKLVQPVGDAGASALAAALGRGAMPRLKWLYLARAAITDVGLLALAPVLRQRPALLGLNLTGNQLGDEGLAALLAPPPLAGAPSPPPTGGLTKLKSLRFGRTQITDTGCAALASALDSGALPALEQLDLHGIPASVAAKAAVKEALQGVVEAAALAFDLSIYENTTY